MDSEHLNSEEIVKPTRTRQQVSLLLRGRLRTHLYDDSTRPGIGTALYYLSDPRETREIRYIGITKSPARRLMQHWNIARLWLPDQTPWWIKSPKLRPLYNWIRDLHRDEYRLPVMLITTWLSDPREARLAERRFIFESLVRHQPLLNFEQEVLGRQVPLL
jgi:hypothetical protein